MAPALEELDEDPLSWHLSPEQQRMVRDAWLAPRNQDELARLKQFLATGRSASRSRRPAPEGNGLTRAPPRVLRSL